MRDCGNVIGKVVRAFKALVVQGDYLENQLRGILIGKKE